MKSWMELLYNTCKVFVLFTGFTVLFYYGMIWVHKEYESYQRYDEPKGAAIKVMSMHVDEEQTWLQRLLMFYQTGE
ncbi:YqzK family protein [Bacillus sp. CGMCC 1.16541]|uniref:YqzK family protein n=1 Tax=Bacillus sp. CGMCC 1.16541 TaxID=2185143 RepID=UPI000D726BA0|nr:YqzK family protein [Bacillus sp. CGMCC 1.16541]